MDINWLDGKDDNGHYIIEIFFKNNTKGFVKNKNYDQICNDYNSYWEMNDIIGMTIYDLNRKVIATKYRAA